MIIFVNTSLLFDSITSSTFLQYFYCIVIELFSHFPGREYHRIFMKIIGWRLEEYLLWRPYRISSNCWSLLASYFKKRFEVALVNNFIETNYTFVFYNMSLILYSTVFRINFFLYIIHINFQHLRSLCVELYDVSLL